MRNPRRLGLLAMLAVVFGVALVPGAAQAGTYNVYSCSIDGGFFGNGAWGAALNPATNPGAIKSTCSSTGDPLQATLIDGNTFVNGSYAGLLFYAPAGTYVSDYVLRVHQYWYAPGLNPSGGQPSETTYNLVNRMAIRGPSGPAGRGASPRLERARRWPDAR